MTGPFKLLCTAHRYLNVLFVHTTVHHFLLFVQVPLNQIGGGKQTYVG